MARQITAADKAEFNRALVRAEKQRQEQKKREEEARKNFHKSTGLIGIVRSFKPVKDQMPNDQTEVLVVNSTTGQSQVGWYDDEHKKWYGNDFNLIPFKVTHWASIPSVRALVEHENSRKS